MDAKEVESVLVATQRRASPGLPVGPAACPAGVPAKEGATLECTILVDGTSAPYVVVVHETDARGDVRYDVRPAKAILLLAKVVEAIQRSTSAPTLTVDCGSQRVRVVEVGATFDCTLTDTGRTSSVTVQVETVEGTVSFKET